MSLATVVSWYTFCKESIKRFLVKFQITYANIQRSDGIVSAFFGVEQTVSLHFL